MIYIQVYASYIYAGLMFSYSFTINSAMKDCLGAYYITFVAVTIHFMCLAQDWEIIIEKTIEN